jgi:predicted Zn-dependent protease with MMP-like domain/Flp pilus assembly protein TadD
VTLEKDLDRAWEQLEKGDLEGARKLADRLAGSAPHEPDVLLLRAACAREAGAVEDALALLAEAAAADPEWAMPEIWSAELLASEPDRLRDALEHAERAVDLAEEEDDYLEAVAVKAGIELDLGKTGAARSTLAELPPADTAGMDPAWALEVGHLLLAAEEAGEARRRFEVLAGADPKLADAWYGVGLAAEALGDEAGKRAAWLRTLSLDEEMPLETPLLSEAEMAAAAEHALAELPPRARKLIENVPIVITDLPARADVDTGLDPRLLGLFAGTSLPETSSLGGASHLTQILLFRKNLERMATGVEELRVEIRTTLIHETGHFFGMSEEDLAAVGLD